MRKILAVTAKEIYTVFRDRNLILLMFATPLVLSTIIGLAFGGIGESEVPDFAEIPVAVVNHDEGVDLQEIINLPEQFANPDALPFDLEDFGFPPNQSAVGPNPLLQDGSELNFGDILSGILLSQPITSTSTVGGAGFDVAQFECSLLDPSGEAGAASFAAEGSLDDLLDATAVQDPEQARAAVDRGEFAAAVIIPEGFSRRMVPQFAFDEGGKLYTKPADETGAVEVYANNGRPISSRILHSIVAGVVNQFERVNVALSAALETSVNTLLDSLAGGDIDLSAVDLPATAAALQGLDATALEPLGCLIAPGANNITVAQEPLVASQEAPPFARIIVPIGAAQAVFFALFTGVFGINSIYEERKNWTLQRLIVSPTPRSYLLAGKLLGNVTVVFLQLLILMSALTLIASAVLGAPTFIWGTNIAALLAVTAALALCVSGLGVFVVGLAKTPEQVQLFGPMINISLAVLGGAFGFALPEQAARFSLIYWGVDAFVDLSLSQLDVSLNILVLFCQGIALFLLGTWLFKRRIDL
ncbi:MAG: ABC transporter permease [Caldilineaceae bacterium]|nr:ABC transporter permease [Caldilineaceae bacterium]MDE0338680.1 ABC transporter permease [Caldilineaceae bacterium]